MSIIERETVEIPAELEQAEDEILILRKAHDLLSDRDNWCSGYDTLSQSPSRTRTWVGDDPWSENVTARCALSAIAWATGDRWNWDNYSEASPRFVAARERLGREVPLRSPRDTDTTNRIVRVNDTEGYEPIMAAFRRAIS